MTDLEKTLEQKRERITKTIRREKTDKVPFMFLQDGYIPYYAGMPLGEITTYDQAMEANRKTFSEIPVDVGYTPYMPMNLMLAPKLELLGGGAHVVGENYLKQIASSGIKIMERDEYPELIKDPTNYLLETIYPRRFKLLASDNQEEKLNKILQMYGGLQQLGEYWNRVETELGLPLILSASLYFNPVDIILDLLRDFPGTMGDVRRCPEELRDAGLAMVDDMVKMLTASAPESYRTLLCPMHLPAFVKPKDFEKIYWPSFKKIAEILVEKGYNIMFMFEKNYSHLYDFLQELPKTNIVGIFNEDDIRVVKKKLGGTMAIAGGLSTNLLYYGTKEECIDHAKGLIDDLAPGGGYFMTFDKPLIFPTDAKPENVRAVAEFINDYGTFK